MISKEKQSLKDNYFSWWDLPSSRKWFPYMVFVIGILAYANTVGHDYTQDDPIVITQNMYTTEGLSGIEGLLSKDTFFGYFKVEGKDQLVAGGRYRPLSLIMFAIEYQLFGENPLPGHIINVLLYGVLGMVVYFLLFTLFSKVIPTNRLALFALIGALIYTLHPVHTEAVANIKGRDEILTMLFASVSWILLLKSGNWKNLVGAGLLFFLAMMSKENAITLVPIIGIGYLLLKHGNIADSLKITVPVFTASLLYLGIRFSILSSGIGDEPMEMMNNPFVKYVDGAYSFFSTSERWATILAGLGEYLRLLVFPHPLTHDYYPREFGVMQWTDVSVIISVGVHFLLGLGALLSIKKQPLIGFALLYYFATISIFSNILFPIGTHLSERFLFMPSLAFAILLSYGIISLYYKNKSYVILIFTALLLVLYGMKTVLRNNVWKNNYTLFTTDVLTSNNSAKALNAAGGALTDASKGEKDEATKLEMLQRAKKYLEKALTIHPTYKNAWLILGNVYYFSGDEQKAIETYDRALDLDPGYPEARKNKALVLRVEGREAGEKLGDLDKATDYFNQSYRLNPQDPETTRLLGIVEGMKGNNQNAIKYFQRYTEMVPQNAYAYVLLSQAYQNAGNIAMMNVNRQKALALDPKAFDKK